MVKGLGTPRITPETSTQNLREKGELQVGPRGQWASKDMAAEQRPRTFLTQPSLLDLQEGQTYLWKILLDMEYKLAAGEVVNLLVVVSSATIVAVADAVGPMAMSDRRLTNPRNFGTSASDSLKQLQDTAADPPPMWETIHPRNGTLKGRTKISRTTVFLLAETVAVAEAVGPTALSSGRLIMPKSIGTSALGFPKQLQDTAVSHHPNAWKISVRGARRDSQ
jgi:hypothetical protein